MLHFCAFELSRLCKSQPNFTIGTLWIIWIINGQSFESIYFVSLGVEEKFFPPHPSLLKPDQTHLSELLFIGLFLYLLNFLAAQHRTNSFRVSVWNRKQAISGFIGHDYDIFPSWAWDWNSLVCNAIFSVCSVQSMLADTRRAVAKNNAKGDFIVDTPATSISSCPELHVLLWDGHIL